MYHRLLYHAIPKLMIHYLALTCTAVLNFSPVKGGVSPYYSPCIIMSQSHLDYEQHCQVPFGAYVQVNHQPNPSNTNAPCMLDAIY